MKRRRTLIRSDGIKDLGTALSFHKINKGHLTLPGLDIFSPNYLIDRIIAPLGQHLGTDHADQINGGIFVKKYHRIHRSKGGKRLADSDLHVQSAAAEAVGRMGSEAATKQVLDSLAEMAYAPEAKGRNLEDTAFDALARLVQFYRPSEEG